MASEPSACHVLLFILHWNRPEECVRTVKAFQSQGAPLEMSQHLSPRTMNIIEQMQAFRRRVNTHAALPNEGSVQRVPFGLWISRQMKRHRIRGFHDLGEKEEAAA